MPEIRSYMNGRSVSEAAEHEEARRHIAELIDSAEAITDRLDGLKTLVQPVLTMYDQLGAVAKRTIAGLLPNFASALDAIREALADIGGGDN